MSRGQSDAEDGESEEETGLPVTQLRELDVPVDPAFTDRVGRSIQRRRLAGDLLQLAWTGPVVALLEILRIAFEWFPAGNTPRRPGKEP